MVDDLQRVSFIHGRFYLLASGYYKQAGMHAQYFRTALRSAEGRGGSLEWCDQLAWSGYMIRGRYLRGLGGHGTPMVIVKFVLQSMYLLRKSGI